MNFHIALVSFIVTFTTTYSARILGIVSSPHFSHQSAFRPLWKELSLRGHTLTVLTTDPVNNLELTNLKEIDMGISYKFWNQWHINTKLDSNHIQTAKDFFSIIAIVGEKQLLLPEVQELIANETEHFDVVLMEPYFLPAAALSERFKCPIIQIFSLDSFIPYYFALGNPLHPSVYPNFLLEYAEDLTFLERLISSISALSMLYLHYHDVIPLQEVIFQRYFQTYNLSLQDILDKTSMMLINVDVVFHSARPLIPNIIQFGGGSHLTSAKLLPKELKASLDNATSGFVYFSLGSTIKSCRLPVTTRNMFMETFAELPFTILWKYEDEELPGKPENVIIANWLPQQDVLKHPNIKLFVNQGGLQSSDEAIYNNVPMLGIPFNGDQHFNMKRFVKRGIALSLDPTTINKNTLKAAILELLNNPSFRNNLNQLVGVIKDQSMTGLERAVWWTEYVIRNNGTIHSRSPAMGLSGYQYLLLDVISFLLVLITIVIYLVFIIIK